MSFRTMSLIVKLSLGFAIIVALTMVVGFVSVKNITSLSGLTERLYNHPFAVSTAIIRIEGNMVAMHRSMKDVALAEDNAGINAASVKVDANEQQVWQDFKILKDRFLGDKTSIQHLEKAFKDWKPIRDEVIEFMHKGKKLEAATITKTKGARHLASLISLTRDFEEFANRKAKEFYSTAVETKNDSIIYTYILTIIAIFFSFLIAFQITRNISVPVSDLTEMLLKASEGDLEDDVLIDRNDELGQMGRSFQKMIETQREIAGLTDEVAKGNYSVTIQPRSDKDRLGFSLGNMTTRLAEMSAMHQEQIWLNQSLTELVGKIRGKLDLFEVAEDICEYLAEKLRAQVASFYILEESGDLILHGDYAFHLRKSLSDKVRMGQGLLGQAARSGKLISITEVPDDYIRISSSLGDTHPANIVVSPFLHEGKVKGVVEFASHLVIDGNRLKLLEKSMESVGVAVSAIQVHQQINSLLEETRINNNTLQSQQEELRAVNEELEEKAKSLLDSEAELQSQQEELRVTNEELEEKNRSMTDKQKEIEQKNIDLEDIRSHLELKARELETSGRYKSEFLANMSHELRTPLNSLLILAQDLRNNKDKNLTEVQLQSAEVIYKGGNDLLKLINEILDLSKIEAGQMTVNPGTVPFTDIKNSLLRQFDQMAQEKGIGFEVHLNKDLPGTITTDFQRLEQILRNLCSNAIKFTQNGKVTVEVTTADDGCDGVVDGGQPAVLFMVSDSGIGIPTSKQSEIFEAFKQVDGSTSREYGGTGLGLSISRELAILLGGVITLESESGKGAVFRLYLPLSIKEQPGVGEGVVETGVRIAQTNAAAVVEGLQSGKFVEAPAIEDDRTTIDENDKIILVIEDDLEFATTLKRFCAERNFRFLHAGDGFTGLILAEQYRPDGIVLDIKLPGLSGWEVLESLKKNEKTRSIPVHIMSVEDTPDQAASMGAIGFLNKPATLESLDVAFKKIESIFSRDVKELLVVEDDDTLRSAIVKLIDDSSVNITAVESAAAAVEKLKDGRYDCMILDLTLPDKSGFDVLEELSALDEIGKPPVIIYTGKELSREEEWKLKKVTSSIILKTAYSTERLLDETALFLHKVTSEQPSNKLRKLEQKSLEEEFTGREVLLVDDDMRNLFALSKILQDKGFKVHQAADGEKALEILHSEEHVELVLMDIMMPVMDGNEAIQRIRNMDKYKKIPIIALTAKAMPADRQKCIEAGASDYIPKPVDMNNLFSLIRIWL